MVAHQLYLLFLLHSQKQRSSTYACWSDDALNQRFSIHFEAHTPSGRKNYFCTPCTIQCIVFCIFREVRTPRSPFSHPRGVWAPPIGNRCSKMPTKTKVWVWRLTFCHHQNFPLFPAMKKLRKPPQSSFCGEVPFLQCLKAEPCERLLGPPQKIQIGSFDISKHLGRGVLFRASCKLAPLAALCQNLTKLN